MRDVVLVVNTKSGEGRNEARARALVEQLLQRGIRARTLGVTEIGTLPEVAHGAGAVLLGGGDGTVRAAAHAIAEADDPPPLWHLGWGTANLVSCSLETCDKAPDIDAALRARRIRRLDLIKIRALAGATAQPRELGHALICASTGPEAGVIRNAHNETRSGAKIWRYMLANLQQIARPTTPHTTIECDGDLIVNDRPGVTLVANLADHLFGLQPAFKADPADGKLDVVFFEASTSITLLGWLAAVAAGEHTKQPGLTYRKCASVRITTREPLALQADGELLLDGSTHAAELAVCPAALPVLLPAH